ncbi:glycosyltransferase family 2 protein [Deinococcus phoenicis]|uniref:glycosyltransferase family 2 protein n=1 Tax=Deinococcus phoenicis TaxID=1476583 RepID=UPI0009DE667D|nr:glycosyltransferase family 2 protein [Deinococcus phoenicis]
MTHNNEAIDSDRILLTIAIPNYNGGENLRRALESCNHVDLEVVDYEILVVDNCSTDNSIAIAKDFAPIYQNLVLKENNANLGRIGNWNECLRFARGKYIIFLFANDEIAESPHLKRKISLMDSQALGLLLSPFILARDSSRTLEKKEAGSIIYKEPSKFMASCLADAALPYAPIQANIYNLEVIKDRKIFFDEAFELTSDQIFSFYVSYYSKRIAFHPIPHIIWNATSTRFHSQVSMDMVVAEDLRTLEYLERHLKIRVSKHRQSAALIWRILRENVFGNSGKGKAIRGIIRDSKRPELILLWLPSILFHKSTRKMLKSFAELRKAEGRWD